MRITRGHFLLLGWLIGATAVAIGATTIDLTPQAHPITFSEFIVLLCIVSPVVGLAFAWIVPVRHDKDGPR